MTDPATENQIAALLELGFSPTAAQAAIEIEAVTAQLRRSMVRRDLGRIALDELQLGVELADLDILHVLETCAGHHGEATVGLIAERLNVDPSRASRIVADAVEKGLIRRVASQSDARRIGLEFTEAGRQKAEALRNFKWQLFAESLGKWSEEDLVTFARLFRRFSGWVAEAKAARDEKG